MSKMATYIGGGLAAVAMIGIFFLSDTRWEERYVFETQKIGNSIAKALEEFKSDYGSYPATLTELTPNYLAVVEPPKVGDYEWDFEREKSGYYLGVDGPDTEFDPVLYRTHAGAEWYMDTR